MASGIRGGKANHERTKERQRGRAGRSLARERNGSATKKCSCCSNVQATKNPSQARWKLMHSWDLKLRIGRVALEGEGRKENMKVEAQDKDQPTIEESRRGENED